jgi:NAD(P)-dependent dehydrogenase (short-subunit alcohol dehydrogenase family)
MAQLQGKVALVTGASSGIGRGIARGLARAGAQLVIAARREAKLAEVAGEVAALGGDVLAVPTDVTDEAAVERLFAATVERFGRLDVLVNNAGAFDGGPIDELSLDAWERVMATNLRGPFLCTRAAFRIMKRQGGGRIINIGSISAQRVRPNSAAYSTSKHGIWGLTQVTALEGRPHGIVCSCLHPGNTRVERAEAAAAQPGAEPFISVDELAAAAVFMATQPPHVNVLEAIVMPAAQPYLGRG